MSTKTKTKPSTEPVEHSALQHVALWFVLVTGTLAFAAGSFLVVSTQRSSAQVGVTQSHGSDVTTVDERVAGLLDGVLVEPGTEAHWPIGVMIENLPVVRPQAGLGSAKLVYETLAEGGATRFFALFDGREQLTKIGPVRSARPYYVQWAMELDALYAHAGGSPSALIEIEGRKVNAINGIAGGAQYFRRDSSLAAPHNLFTSMDELNRALVDKGLSAREPDVTRWTYKDDASLDERGTPTARLTVAFSSISFEAAWEYHRDTNSYFRFNAGAPHRDSLTGEIIQAKNVIVQFLPQEKLLPEKGRIGLDLTGRGRALIFRDGHVIEATWSRPTIFRRTEWLDANGAAVLLDRGTTWVEAVPGDRSVTYE